MNRRKNNDFIQMNCTIPKKLHSQVKAISFLDGKHLNTVVTQALDNWLKNYAQQETPNAQ